MKVKSKPKLTLDVTSMPMLLCKFKSNNSNNLIFLYQYSIFEICFTNSEKTQERYALMSVTAFTWN